MAIAAVSTSLLSVVTSSTDARRLPISSLCCLASLRPTICSLIPKATVNRKDSSLSNGQAENEIAVASQKKVSRRAKDSRSYSYADDNSSLRDGKSSSTTFQSNSISKDKRGLFYDSMEQQVEVGNLQDSAFLNAVVKVYCTHTAPDYSLPWQKQRQYTSTGSAFMIGDGKLLTNAHCVEHDTQVKVKKRGDDRKYVAKVLARGIDCDVALLSVESKEFWKGAEPLRFGRLPSLQEEEK